MFAFRLEARITTPAKSSTRCSRKLTSWLAKRSCESATRVRWPNSASASSKNRIQPLVLGEVEHARQVLLGLADVLGHDHAEVELVDVAAAVLAEQARGQRLAGAGRAVEQAEVPGAQLVAHAPFVQQPAAVPDPALDLLELGERRARAAPGRSQSSAVRTQARGELVAERRLALQAGGEAVQVARARAPARRSERRLAGRHRRERAARRGARGTARRSNRRGHREARGEVFAGEQERGGLAGRDEAAVARALHARRTR